jgi:hypothetical protein
MLLLTACNSYREAPKTGNKQRKLHNWEPTHPHAKINALPQARTGRPPLPSPGRLSLTPPAFCTRKQLPPAASHRNTYASPHRPLPSSLLRDSAAQAAARRRERRESEKAHRSTLVAGVHGRRRGRGDAGRCCGGLLGRRGLGGGGGDAAEVRGGAGVPQRGGVPGGGGRGVRPGAGAHRHDAGRALPAGVHGGGVLAAQARVLPGVDLLPLPGLGGRRRGRGGAGAGAAAARGGRVVPVAAVRDLPVPRRGRGGAHLGVRARRARGAAQLRAEPPGGPAPALRAPGDIPRLRRARRRRRQAALGDAPARRRRGGGARVLPRQLVPLLHAGLLVRPGPRRARLRRAPPPAMLLQHRRHGHRPPPLARRQLPPAHRALDGDPEGEAHLRAGLAAPVLARLRRRGGGRRPPLEPARPRRRQRARQLPPAPRRARQPHALVGQGQALGPPRCRQAVPARPHLEVI